MLLLTKLFSPLKIFHIWLNNLLLELIPRDESMLWKVFTFTFFTVLSCSVYFIVYPLWIYYVIRLRVGSYHSALHKNKPFHFPMWNKTQAGFILCIYWRAEFLYFLYLQIETVRMTKLFMWYILRTLFLCIFFYYQ